jgi:enoyl-CoA hydratase
MSTPLLHVEERGLVTLLTIARPPAGAINHAMTSELVLLLPRLQAARAVVVTGQGRFFSAGLDLVEVFGYEGAAADAFSQSFDDAVTGLFALEVPVVAAVNGHAIAGGCVLAATADFRLMADGAGKIGLPEILVGVPFPTSALEPVRCRAGGRYLPEVLLRGLTYEPPAALERNLIDEIVPGAELLERALGLAAELAAPPPVAFSSTKRVLRRAALGRMAEARRGSATGGDPAWSAWRTPEVLQAMAAYRQRTLKRAGT